jgi:hypothetical protein
MKPNAHISVHVLVCALTRYVSTCVLTAVEENAAVVDLGVTVVTRGLDAIS